MISGSFSFSQEIALKVVKGLGNMAGGRELRYSVRQISLQNSFSNAWSSIIMQNDGIFFCYHYIRF